MPSLLENILFSFVDLVRATILVGIPVLVLAFIGRKLHVILHQRRTWVQSTFLTTYILIFALIIVEYFVPFWLGLTEFSQGAIPQNLAPTLFDRLTAYITALIRVVLLTAFFSVLLFPLALFGAAVQDTLTKHVSDNRIAFGTAVLVSVFAALLLILFVLPSLGIGVVPGAIYLIYFA